MLTELLLFKQKIQVDSSRFISTVVIGEDNEYLRCVPMFEGDLCCLCRPVS